MHASCKVKSDQERPYQTYCFLLFLFKLVMFANGMTTSLAMKMTSHLQFRETATDPLEHTPLNVR